MGPWSHSQVKPRGMVAGPLQWTGDTTASIVTTFCCRFFTQYLVDGAPRADTAAGAGVQHRRKPLGPLHPVADELRERLPNKSSRFILKPG